MNSREYLNRWIDDVRFVLSHNPDECPPDGTCAKCKALSDSVIAQKLIDAEILKITWSECKTKEVP